MKALLVHHDPAVRACYREIGRELGLEVITTPQPAEGWEIFQRESPSVVVLDWYLPGMDALELCRRLRAAPGGDACIIVVVTSGNSPDQYLDVLEAGADDYLPKPVTQELLLVRLAIAKRRAEHLTQRRRMEAELRSNEERFQLVARATNNAIWDWDIRGNRIEWNDGITTLFGYTRDQVRPDPEWWVENVHPEERHRLVASLEEAIQGTGATWGGEYLFRCADGFYMMVEDRAYIVRDDAGGAVRMVGTMMNITERKQAEATILQLAAFAQLNPNPVLEFAADGNLNYFNEATQRLADALGKKHPVEMLPSDAAAIIRDCLASGRSRLRRESQMGGRIISWSFYPLLTLRRVHCYAGDITEKVTLEAQLRQSQKLESIGRLSAGVAHDFNNVLTIIRGYSSLLLATKSPDARTREALEQIGAATERAAHLTRQLLMFSRKQAITRANLNLNDVVESVARMIGRVLGEDIKLELNAEKKLPTVFADAGMMDQVIMNLAVNARDAMPRGGTLTLTTAVEEVTAANVPKVAGARAGRFVRLTVADTGTGIPAEILEKIFEPFFTTKEIGKGTGLGLATVFGIVNQHEGWVEVRSEVGRGTEFKVMLPVSDRSVEGTRRLPSAIGTLRGGHETILVVEDEPALRALARTILQRYGYRVLEAANAVEAGVIWADNRGEIALLLTDFALPEGVSGADLGKQLAAEKPELKVIYSSGYSLELAAHGIELKEGENFLQKPFQVEALARAVRASLDA
ncbi:MAG: response regulator [Verrucomicrobia bacterium]|nr:response regulator [Verrucomicrobiota bacterium]